VRSREADVFDSAFLRSLSGSGREPENPVFRKVITVPRIFLTRLPQARNSAQNIPTHRFLR
jgi:hypothetical protein